MHRASCERDADSASFFHEGRKKERKKEPDREREKKRRKKKPMQKKKKKTTTMEKTSSTRLTETIRKVDDEEAPLRILTRCAEGFFETFLSSLVFYSFYSQQIVLFRSSIRT